MSLSSRDNTSVTLLARLASGSDEAWTSLVDFYSPLIYRWARRQGFQPDDAAELLQETFLLVSSRIDIFRRRRRGAFRKWIWTIVRFKAMALKRGTRRWPMLDVDLDGYLASLADTPLHLSPDRNSDSDDEPFGGDVLPTNILSALEQVQDRVQSHTWRAFWLTTIQTRSAAEVAETLSISVATVHQSRSRCLRRLREIIAEKSRSP